eukprot:2475175-Pyramimonas_sp.AAC.1
MASSRPRARPWALQCAARLAGRRAADCERALADLASAAGRQGASCCCRACVTSRRSQVHRQGEAGPTQERGDSQTQ